MEIYLVGGAVRDQLLEYPYHEKDWVVVGATPEELIEQGFQPVGKDFPVFLHPQSKEEYALARTERKTGPGYTGFDCFASPSVTLEEDLQRRDLTINAMAMDLQGKLIDPYNGQQDVTDRVLRHVSPAFTEDPLRVLRVARFAARYAHLGFTIAPETLSLMAAITDSGELNALPAERIWKEFERALGERSPQQFFLTLKKCGALKTLMPELQTTSTKIYQALDQAAAQQQPSLICFALLFVDLAADDSKALCARIKAPNQFRDLALLVSLHGRRLKDAAFDSERLLNVLETSDAFRKPERFQQLLACQALLANDSTVIEQLQTALKASISVDPAAIAASGLKGKAIAEELHRQRIVAVNQSHRLWC